MDGNVNIEMPLEDIISEKIKFHEKQISILRNQRMLIASSLGLEPSQITSNFKAPSAKEMRDNITKFFVGVMDRWVKTAEIVDAFHPTIHGKKERELLVRRYSITLGKMEDDKRVWRKKIEGEKGDSYTMNGVMALT